MRYKPNGQALLNCAAQLLRNEVLPALPSEHKHALLMSLNAMSIAARQLKYGDIPEHDEILVIEGLLDKDFKDLHSANEYLGKLLRAGAGDPNQPLHKDAFAFLKSSIRQRLMESNPKVLAD